MSQEHLRWSPENPVHLKKYQNISAFLILFSWAWWTKRKRWHRENSWKPVRQCQTWKWNLSGFGAEEPPRSQHATGRPWRKNKEKWMQFVELVSFVWQRNLVAATVDAFSDKIICAKLRPGRKSTTLHKFTKNLTLQKQAGFYAEWHAFWCLLRYGRLMHKLKILKRFDFTGSLLHM